MAQEHELVQRDYILDMPYKEIAAKYAVSIETVKYRKTHGCSRDKTTKKGAPIAPLKIRANQKFLRRSCRSGAFKANVITSIRKAENPTAKDASELNYRYFK